MKWFVYIVECKDGSLYTGYTNNVDKRVDKHNKGAGAKYTRSRRPVKLVYKKKYSTRSAAMKAEYAMKQKTRNQKMIMILIYEYKRFIEILK